MAIIEIGNSNGVLADVSSPSAAYLEMSKRWRLVDALTGGTEAMRERGAELLPLNTYETSQSYRRRLHSTFLYEGFNGAIETLLGKPFSEDVKPSTEIEKSTIAPYLTNMDMCGNDLTTICRQIAEVGLRRGLCHVLVDYTPRPTLDRQPNLLDKQIYNLRPYAVVIDPERVIGWRFDLMGNIPILSMVRILEEVNLPVGKFGEVCAKQVRVFERVTENGATSVSFSVYRQDQSTKDWSIIDSGPTSLKTIPLLTVYFGKKEGFFQARPPLMGVAWLNLEHWQSSSEQRNILNVARCPIWFFAGYDESVDDEGAPVPKVVIAPDAMIRASDPGASLKLVEHSGQAIGSGRQDLLDIEARMAHLSVDMLTKKASSSSSATEKAHDNSGEDSKLASMIKAEEDLMTSVLGLFLSYEEEEVPKGKLVDINTAFGLEPQDAADLQVLYQSRMSGQLSHRKYLIELQRRGVLSANTDIDLELAEAAKDGPVEVASKDNTGSTMTAKGGAGA